MTFLSLQLSLTKVIGWFYGPVEKFVSQVVTWPVATRVFLPKAKGGSEERPWEQGWSRSQRIILLCVLCAFIPAHLPFNLSYWFELEVKGEKKKTKRRYRKWKSFNLYTLYWQKWKILVCSSPVPCSCRVQQLQHLTHQRARINVS